MVQKLPKHLQCSCNVYKVLSNFCFQLQRASQLAYYDPNRTLCIHPDAFGQHTDGTIVWCDPDEF